jgi:hypothetical protein
MKLLIFVVNDSINSRIMRIFANIFFNPIRLYIVNKVR